MASFDVSMETSVLAWASTGTFRVLSFPDSQRNRFVLARLQFAFPRVPRWGPGVPVLAIQIGPYGSILQQLGLDFASGRHVVTTPRRDSRWICGRARVASGIASWRVNTVPCPADVLVSRQVFSKSGSASSDAVQIDVTASFRCFEQVIRTSQGMASYFQGWQSIIS